jgi:hypothetical protein
MIYTVGGTAESAKITYANGTGGTTIVDSLKDQGTDPNGHVHWTKAVLLPAGEMAYLTAQNSWRTGTVAVKIAVDGQAVKSSESSGEYCIATASY